jgi:hypothetical protein
MKSLNLSGTYTKNLSETYTKIFRDCGIEVEFFWTDNPETVATLCAVYTNDDLSLDHLQRLSRALGTRDINLTCDRGSTSDSCHDKTIMVRNIRLPR